jgi:SpoVK/Ycf46/Vps4 family AAA+-type ATPase
MLFLYLGELEAMVKEHKAKQKKEKKKKIRKANARKIAHVKILIDYLNEDYKETKATLYPLLKSNLITFDLLWALFKPNTIAYTPTYGNADEPRAFRVEYAQKECSFMKGEWYTVEGRYLEYDGKAFGMGTMECVVESFKGARKISSLACFPLKYHKDEKALRELLIARGRKFVDLKGMKYRFHKGMAFYKKKRSVIKVNINGRIMIDPAIFRRINPNYSISTVKPKDPEEVDSDSEDEFVDSECGCCASDDDDDQGQGADANEGGDSDGEKTKIKVVVDNGKVHVVSVKVDSEGDEIPEEKIDKLVDDSEAEKEKERIFTDDELLIASPVVHGFAFSEKMWLEFSVSGVNEIEWNEGAFGSLVLPENQKSIVKALVESHTFHAAQNIDDVIQGKGKGLVAVLHGPPGTGKTLTAEGIAELLKCPLYMVSAGELGTDPRTLEAELNKILDIAHSWGAVLLLDEADVFLEKRTIQDIHRNALVSIFLRLLEYFQGILFLTTNRVETFDDAFQSRIHVALRYGELTFKAKRTVWTMFLQRVQAMEGVETAVFRESDYDSLARNNLNGRQVNLPLTRVLNDISIY